MQVSLETTTSTTSTLVATLSSAGKSAPGNSEGHRQDNKSGSPAETVLEAASKKAEKDAVVIAALQKAADQRKGETEEDSEKKALASIEDYRKTAGKLKTALGEKDIRDEGRESLLKIESATISTTTIEAQIGDETLTAEFVSIDRVSYDSQTGLSARSATATSIEADFDDFDLSYQSASVSSLYAGTSEQLGNLLSGTA